MTIEDFQNLLKARKCLLKGKDLPSALSFSILNKKDKVGVRFYSGTPLKEFNKLNGPWLYFVTVSFDPFKEMGVEVGFSKHRKLKGKDHDEGSVVEISLSKIKKTDEQIIRFGEALAQFIHATFEDKNSAEKNREDYNLNYEAFVRAYAKRRLESGDGLSEGEVKNHAISSTQQEMLPMTNKEVLCALYDKLMNSDDRKSAVEEYKTFCEKVSQANEAEDLSLKEWLYKNVVYMKGDNGVAPLGQNNQIPERDRLKQDEFFQVLDDMLSAAKTPGAEVRYAEWKNCFSAAIKKKNEKAKKQNYVFNRIIAAFFPAKVTPIPSAGGFKKIYTWMFENGFLSDEKKAGDWYGQNKAVMQALDEVFNDRSEIDEYCKGCFAWQLFACLEEGCDPMDLIKDEVDNKGSKDQSDAEDGVPKNEDGVPKNLILFGPPGTGKTYHTVFRAVEIIDGRKQDQSLTEGKVEYAEVKKRYDDLKREGRIQMVTFHQAYGYEEFIGGIRPESNEKGEISYPVRPGVFVAFCKKAKEDFNKKYVFIIDEINRGNVAKIFGELITLLEENKRLGAKEETTVAIPGFEKDSIDEKFEYERCFAVPQNVYIIGTMNTADRSLAKLDVALRRRFVFEEMMPKCELLPNNINGVNLNEMLKVMNLRIQFLVDREHQIGHAWLMGVKDLESLGLVFRQKIIPLLQEYFYDDYSKIRKVLNDDKKEKVNKAFAFFTEIQRSELGAGWLDDEDDVDARYELNGEAFKNHDSYSLIYDK